MRQQLLDDDAPPTKAHLVERSDDGGWRSPRAITVPVHLNNNCQDVLLGHLPNVELARSRHLVQGNLSQSEGRVLDGEFVENLIPHLRNPRRRPFTDVQTDVQQCAHRGNIEIIPRGVAIGGDHDRLATDSRVPFVAISHRRMQVLERCFESDSSLHTTVGILEKDWRAGDSVGDVTNQRLLALQDNLHADSAHAVSTHVTRQRCPAQKGI